MGNQTTFQTYLEATKKTKTNKLNPWDYILAFYKATGAFNLDNEDTLNNILDEYGNYAENVIINLDKIKSLQKEINYEYSEFNPKKLQAFKKPIKFKFTNLYKVNEIWNLKGDFFYFSTENKIEANILKKLNQYGFKISEIKKSSK